jgi:hypothetical protein
MIATGMEKKGTFQILKEPMVLLNGFKVGDEIR